MGGNYELIEVNPAILVPASSSRCIIATKGMYNFTMYIQWQQNVKIYRISLELFRVNSIMSNIFDPESSETDFIAWKY